MTSNEHAARDAATGTPIVAEEAGEGLRTVLDYLTSIPAWYLATCEGDQPHVRPFSFAALEGGRLWFCTATTKDVYRELQANPKFELTAWKREAAGSSCAARPTWTIASEPRCAARGTTTSPRSANATAAPMRPSSRSSA